MNLLEKIIRKEEIKKIDPKDKKKENNKVVNKK